MRYYGSFGFRRFVLCLGFKAEVIKEYFLNYYALNSDFTVKLKTNDMTVHSVDHDLDWEVTMAYTGESAMTGARVARAAQKYLGDAEQFAVTYGDGLTDADLVTEYAFHRAHGKIGTLLGIHPPSRFGEIVLDGDTVVKFEEKPEFTEEWINGGFFFFRGEFLDYLSTDEGCILERSPLVRLAGDGELNMFTHTGFWACMDSQRDRDSLEELWAGGKAPWAV